MTDLTEATRATRSWRVERGVTGCGYFAVNVSKGDFGEIKKLITDAMACVDRLNLLAVLEAIREPSERMLRASDRFAHTDETENIDWKGIARIQWRAMIDALIAEVREQGND